MQVKFSNLTIEIEQTNSKSGETEVTYRFVGDVDENFRQQDVPRIKAKNINLILDGIQNFNSCGIREWINMLRDIEACGKTVFKKCSVTMVDQINLVPDTLGSGTVESFFAPYFCKDHGETVCEIKTQDKLDLLLKKSAPEMKCQTCQKPLEFDALEESYFLFVEEANNRIPKAS